MRVHGRATVDIRRPESHAVCDFCGFRYLHRDLQWQFQWSGPKLTNLRFLVCKTCLDKPQEQLRTIVIPPDPVPIQNPRPENFVNADNPMSQLGANASPLLVRFSAQIGNLTGGGGVPSAFDSNFRKPAWMSACNTVSNSSFNNYVGINWGGDVSGITTPSSLAAPVHKHTLSSFTAYAPNDRSFLGNASATYAVQGSIDALSWVTLFTSTTTGANGEVISGTITAAGPYQFHRLAITGDGVNFVSIAQLQLNVAEVDTVQGSP